jgi:hypothetical protein
MPSCLTSNIHRKSCPEKRPIFDLLGVSYMQECKRVVLTICRVLYLPVLIDIGTFIGAVVVAITHKTPQEREQLRQQWEDVKDLIKEAMNIVSSFSLSNLFSTDGQRED